MSGVLKLKLQVYLGEEIAMGPGKAALLEAIVREGSISGAARAMGMSYRRAWLLVDAMNRCGRSPLVTAVPGRGRGSGARVTPAGQEMLAAYREMEQGAQAAAGGKALRRLQAALRRAPRPPGGAG